MGASIAQNAFTTLVTVACVVIILYVLLTGKQGFDKKFTNVIAMAFLTGVVFALIYYVSAILLIP